MKPPNALWLLRHELRLFLRGVTGKSAYGPILLFVALLVWSALSWIIAAPTAKILPPHPFEPSLGLLAARTAISAGLAGVTSLMLSQAITSAVNQIYTRNDLDLLFSSPVSPWTVLVVRASSIAIQVCQIYVALTGPAIISLAILHSPVWLFALGSIILIGMTSTGVGLLMVLVLFRVIGPRLTRTLAQILSAIVGAGIFLSFQAYNIGGAPGVSTLLERISSLNKDPDAFWLLPARAFLGEWTSFVLLTLLSSAVFLSGTYLFSRYFVSDVASALSVGNVRKAPSGRTGRMVTALGHATFRKEIKLLRRDPLLISGVGLQLVYMVFYLLPLFFALATLGDPSDAGLIRYVALASGLTVFAGSLAFSLTWITVSAEDCPDLIASAPVRKEVINQAKAKAALTPILLLFGPLILGLTFLSPTAGVWAGLGCTSAALCSAIVQVWRRVPAQRRDFRKTSGSPSLSAGLGQFLITSCLSAAVAAGAGGLPWLALPPILIGAAILGALRPENLDAKSRRG